ncbi:MAG: hypothetical protein CMJ36_01980 [Phycisphaerae bacterium]|nr:hypothetical protein [Phycisphaerae bacterium]
MGRFEIFLIIIGIGWTIISAIAQKKAKAAKMAALEADDLEPVLHLDDEEQPEEAVSVRADLADSSSRSSFEQLRQRRLAQLRSRAGQVPGGVAASGGSIVVPPRPSDPPPRPQRKQAPAEPASGEQVEAIEVHSVEQKELHQAAGEDSMANRLRTALGNKGKIREAILLHEILSKPLAMRGRSAS